MQRAFVHDKMKNLCARYRNPPAHIPFPLIAAPLETEIQNIADAFVELQEARHSADYDTGTPLDRYDVLQKIDLVERAFSDWNTIKNKPNANVFLAALLFEGRWRN